MSFFKKCRFGKKSIKSTKKCQLKKTRVKDACVEELARRIKTGNLQTKNEIFLAKKRSSFNCKMFRNVKIVSCSNF